MPKSRSGGEETAGGRPHRPVVLTMRGTPEWRAWIERLSRHCRMTTTTVIDQALVRYAREMDFNEPAPER